MKRIFILIYLLSVLTGCSDKIETEKYPVIDLVGSVEKYQQAFCSDYFSSIDLIPLETNEECLLPVVPSPKIILKDSFIFMSGNCLYAFDGSGKFLNQIGRKGQGPDEYLYCSSFFINTDKSVLYVEDFNKIPAYDFNGNYIRTIQTPKLDDKKLIDISYVGDDLFIGSMFNDGKNKYKYCLFDKNGEITACFPNHVFFNREKERASTYDRALNPIRVDNQLYLKDYINDTLYILEKSKLQPAYIFGLGKYSYPIEYLEAFNIENLHPLNSFIFGIGLNIVGTPKFFFYNIRVPDLFSKPKAKPRYSHLLKKTIPNDSYVYGIYNIEQKTNILLDTDDHSQKGFVNDLNGGLPFVPKYYAGNGLVVDVWHPETMKEMLTEEYFASQTIKDQQAYQKLKEVLKDLKEDDNPVVVVAKLK